MPPLPVPLPLLLPVPDPEPEPPPLPLPPPPPLGLRVVEVVVVAPGALTVTAALESDRGPLMPRVQASSVEDDAQVRARRIACT